MTSFEILKIQIFEAFDIAKETIQEHPFKNWNQSHIELYFNNIERQKNIILSLENKNLSELKRINSEFLTLFQEGSGLTVDIFWKRLKEENIPFKRVDIIAKILKRKRIKDQEEYDIVVDTMVPRAQESSITQEEFAVLSKMVGNYEERLSKGTK